MDDSFRVNVTDAGEQFLPDARSLRFGEVLLLPDALQQLATLEQFHDDVSMCLKQKKQQKNNKINKKSRKNEWNQLEMNEIIDWGSFDDGN